MKQFWALNKRNLKIYFKDYSAVFFSFLSVLIVILLSVFFLGNVAESSFLEPLKNIPGRDAQADKTAVREIVYLWTVAGILTISAASITHAFYANMIKDRKDNRLNSILVMPIGRNQTVLAFVFGAFLASVIMGALTLIITEIIGFFRGFGIFSFTEHIRILLLICVNSFVYSSVMYFFATLGKSESAWGAVGIIIGTLSGFFGGIYLSVGSLNAGIVKIIKCFPFIYGTSLFREVMLGRTEDAFFEGLPGEVREGVDAYMGTSLTLFEKELPAAGKIGILILTGVLFCVLSVIVLKVGKKKDR
ncbi:MAG: ABC transporter permease [Lachnospiraceae bacterium]|nr:ABC transporter permease [Lachnospiraceae bacterium]